MADRTRALYYGDNLDALRGMPGESVDLVYLDPPFNSQADYNVIFREHKGGMPSKAQITAFEDTWHWTAESERALADLTASHGVLAEYVDQTVRRLGKNDLSAYLTMMAVRLVEMQRVLKLTGSLYLHCDPTASHYLKLVLDIIFGPTNFRNEIIWKRTSAHSSAHKYGPVHDVLLFYSRTSDYIWQPVHLPYDDEYVRIFFDQQDPDGRRWKRTDLTGAGVRHGETGEAWRGIDVTAKGRHWMYPPRTLDHLDRQGRVHWPKREGGVPRLKQYPEDLKGVPLQDVWSDIRPMHNLSRERLGYPTQKPVALLERIVAVSSEPGGLVMDPFCGCGTAVAAAEKLGRGWIGIDITHLSVALIQARLKRDFGLEPGVDYKVEGTPRDLAAARYLMDRDPFQFQFWAVGLLGAQPYGANGGGRKGKKGGDTGIDGLLFFRTPGGEKVERIIVSVKGGKSLNPAMVRELAGTVERDKAAQGILITLDEPTRGMIDEATKAGLYEYDKRTAPRVQIITVGELLDGKRPKMIAGVQNLSLEAKRQESGEDEAKRKGMDPLFS